jgi:hypothetical protein
MLFALGQALLPLQILQALVVLLKAVMVDLYSQSDLKENSK